MTTPLYSASKLRRAIWCLGIMPVAAMGVIWLLLNVYWECSEKRHLHQLQIEQAQRQIERYWNFAQQHPIAEAPEAIFGEMAEFVFSNPHLQSLIFFDTQDREIARFGLPIRSDQRLPSRQAPTLYTAQQTWINSPAPFGRFIAVFDRQPLIIAFFQTVAFNLCLLLGGCVVIAWLGTKLHTQINHPLKDLILFLKAVRSGRTPLRDQTTNYGVYQELFEHLDDTLSYLHHFDSNLQHSVEQATAELRETLETVEIQNIELDLARKNAIHADRIKSEFLAKASDEVKTPLSAVQEIAQQLLRTELTEQQKEYVGNLLQTLHRVLALISDVQDFSRLQTGQLQLEYKTLNLRQMVNELFAFYAPQANTKYIRLLSIFDQNLPDALLGDPLRVKQVLNTFIANALKFSNHGNILLEVAVEFHSDRKIQLKISVSDDGIGLTEDQQQDLFNAFAQHSQERWLVHPGAGLGLPIAKGLVDQMDGTIGLESQPNQGSTFWFTAHFGLTDKIAPKQQAKLLAGTKVLVIDDQDISRREICHILTAWDIQPLATRTEDLELYHQEKPQVAILEALDAQHRFTKSKTLQLIAHLNNAWHLNVVLLASPAITRQLGEDINTLNMVVIQRPLQLHQLYQALTNQMGAQRQQRLPAAASAPAAEWIKILVVDDNPSNTRLVFEFLKKCQIHTRIANSGAEAVALFQQEKFDLVLMDIQMPHMDGFETTQRLRHIEGLVKRTPIIAFTAHAVNEHRAKLISAGMDDYLSKPVSFEELTGIVRKWLGPDATPHIPQESPAPLSELLPDPIIEPEKNTRLFDWSESMRLAKHNAELARDMLQMLLDSLPDTRAQIQHHVAQQNWPELQNLAHKFYGGCCYCGVPSLKHASKMLDQNLQRQEFAQTPELAQLLILQIEQLSAWSDNYDIATLFADDLSLQAQ